MHPLIRFCVLLAIALQGSLAQTAAAQPESIDVLRQHAQSGELMAMHQLGMTLLNDTDNSNDAEGLDWLRRAARAGRGRWYTVSPSGRRRA